MQNERLAKFLRVTIYLQKFSLKNEKVVKAEDNSLFPNRVSFELTSKYVFNAKLSFIATYISAPFKNHIFFHLLIYVYCQCLLQLRSTTIFGDTTSEIKARAYYQ